MPTDVPPHDRGTLVAWIETQSAIFNRWLEAEFVETDLTKSPGGAGLIGPHRETINLCDALSASAHASLRAQEDLMRRWAERVAADPRASKLTVEAAHQMYELALTCTSTKGAFYDSWFATLRAVEFAPFTGAWRGVFRAWRGALGSGATTRRDLPAEPDSGPH